VDINHNEATDSDQVAIAWVADQTTIDFCSFMQMKEVTISGELIRLLLKGLQNK